MHLLKNKSNWGLYLPVRDASRHGTHCTFIATGSPTVLKNYRVPIVYIQDYVEERRGGETFTNTHLILAAIDDAL